MSKQQIKQSEKSLSARGRQEGVTHQKRSVIYVTLFVDIRVQGIAICRYLGEGQQQQINKWEVTMYVDNRFKVSIKIL